jgi:hypothetical protein
MYGGEPLPNDLFADFGHLVKINDDHEKKMNAENTETLDLCRKQGGYIHDYLTPSSSNASGRSNSWGPTSGNSNKFGEEGGLSLFQRKRVHPSQTHVWALGGQSILTYKEGGNTFKITRFSASKQTGKMINYETIMNLDNIETLQIVLTDVKRLAISE